jgi:hypothetical protein
MAVNEQAAKPDNSFNPCLSIATLSSFFPAV